MQKFGDGLNKAVLPNIDVQSIPKIVKWIRERFARGVIECLHW